MTSPKIAIVGTTRAGKSVFITVLAKHLETKRAGARFLPRGGSPKNTYVQIEEWWNELQAGNWLAPTPPGTLIELNWDFVINEKKIPVQMFDYAGETLTDLFSSRASNAEGAAKEYFDQVRNAFESASVLLVLLNLESLIGPGIGRAAETKGTLITAMTAFLEKIKADKRDCRVCFIFTAYDRYKSMIAQQWGDVRNFLEQEIPPLYYEFVDEKSNVQILSVAAVGETEIRVDPHTGTATLYPKPGFQPKSLDKIVAWLVKATSDSELDLAAKAETLRLEQQNEQFLQSLEQGWESVQHSTQLEPVERFLEEARSSFPYPQMPNVGELDSQRQRIVDLASDLQSHILARIRGEATEVATERFSLVAKVAALVVGGILLLGIWGKEVKRQESAATAAREERLKQPRPEFIPGEKATKRFNCIEGWLYGCSEHRLIATVPVWNNGGAGNITVKVVLGNGRSNSIRGYFEADERRWVTVTLNNLPDHNNQEAYYDLSAAQ